MKKKLATVMVVILVLGQMLCSSNILSAASENGKGQEKKADQSNISNNNSNAVGTNSNSVPDTIPTVTDEAVNIDAATQSTSERCLGAAAAALAGCAGFAGAGAVGAAIACQIFGPLSPICDAVDLSVLAAEALACLVYAAGVYDLCMLGII